jgi:cytochrome b
MESPPLTMSILPVLRGETQVANKPHRRIDPDQRQNMGGLRPCAVQNRLMRYLMHRLRAYHAVLAILAVLAYLTGEMGLIHAWLGYGVAALIVMRLALALFGLPQLGLFRFYPRFDRLTLGNAMTHPAISHTLLAGIAFSLITATATGIAMDGGRAIGLAQHELIASAYADDRDGERRGEREHDEGALSEMHELSANLLLLIVALHVTYLLLCKRPLALFMLYVGAPQSVGRRRGRG